MFLITAHIQNKKAGPMPAGGSSGEQQTFEYDSDADLSFVQSGIAEEEDVDMNLDVTFDLELTFTQPLFPDRSNARAPPAKPTASLLTPSLFSAELRHRHSFSCSLVRLLSVVLVRERLSKFFGHTMKLSQRGIRVRVMYCTVFRTFFVALNFV